MKKKSFLVTTLCIISLSLLFITGCSGGSSGGGGSTTNAIGLSASTLSVAVGSNSTLSATTTPAGQTVDWTVSDSGIATVSQTGEVHGMSNGITTIWATIQGTQTVASCIVAVGTVPPMAFDQSNYNAVRGTQSTLSVTNIPISASSITLTWTPDGSVGTRTLIIGGIGDGSVSKSVAGSTPYIRDFTYTANTLTVISSPGTLITATAYTGSTVLATCTAYMTAN